ncbi:ABC transporter ATP-binding protein [Abyssisolibacter fermentans]|uniref:ABC transporter ATP-binding protein n=1 Tax=Abyssisolibacter fermentans TaxID=1766203 RepID=UPI0008367434|nr:ABC transporter ATP-binding protein [Abyssisolibacter fermentans]
MEYILRTYNLTKAYKQQEVVSNVSMNIKKGEIYGFLGPNGAGKTTVMKMITNLVIPTAGDIEIFGEKKSANPYECMKRIGSLIEYPIFYEKLNGRENIELHLEYMGCYDKKAIDDALKLVNLRGIDKKPVKNFSMGMKQRLGIARAIITKPELLILDEPINGLDPSGIKEIRDILKMLSREYGITILISSHILSEIEQIADTIGVISKGRLIKEVSMNSIRQKSMEYIEVEVEDCKRAGYILDNKLHVNNFKIMDEKTIRIYDTELSLNEVSKALVLNDIIINTISKKQSSLENYFLKLVDGGVEID